MDEQLRQNVVKQFERLNLQHNPELRQVVSFAANLCQTPISLITLIDKNTQWIKVKKGINRNIDRMPRELSFCTQFIKRKNLLIIDDTQLDKRFNTHPSVTAAPRIRFYAGAPLITQDGHCIGSLCVMDYKPHTLTAQEKLMFKILSKHAISVMELKLSLDQLDKSLTSLKQMREHKAGNEIKLRSMFESLTDSYFLLGEEGEIIDFNRAAYSFVKNKYDEPLSNGRKMIDFLTPAFHAAFALHYSRALKGTSMQLERLADYGRKGTIWWNCVFEPVRNDNGDIIGVTYVIRNINDSKLHEKTIIDQNHLLTRIAQIQSHDYRGPVASILGLMNLIKEDDYVASREELIMLNEATERLDEKIHEVVDMVSELQLNN